MGGAAVPLGFDSPAQAAACWLLLGWQVEEPSSLGTVSVRSEPGCRVPLAALSTCVSVSARPVLSRLLHCVDLSYELLPFL